MLNVKEKLNPGYFYTLDGNRIVMFVEERALHFIVSVRGELERISGSPYGRMVLVREP